VVGADDVVNTKPHPEPYLAAMAALAPRAPGLRPAECLVIEDSMAGIASGLAAGMRVMAVAHSYPKGKLTAAHQVVESLEGLTPDRLRAVFSPAREAP
jgi:beta-phosphoglucomutase-like phosphatase (HAD superfamily)